MKTSIAMRMAGVALLVGAAATGGYVVYQAQRTEPVLVAAHNIAPYSFVTPNDFTVKYIPIRAVFPDVARSVSQVQGHMTTLGILSGSQIRAGMFNTANSLQGMVDTTSQAESVTFSLAYKPGSLDSYISPDSYVDLVASGPNNSILHADNIHVLANTGYSAAPTSANVNSNANPNPILVMTVTQTQYMDMEQAIAGSSLQVLMIPQNAQTGLQATLGTQTLQGSENLVQNADGSSVTTQNKKSGSSTSSTLVRTSQMKGGTSH